MAIVNALLALGPGTTPAGRPTVLLSEVIPPWGVWGPLAVVHSQNQASAAAEPSSAHSARIGAPARAHISRSWSCVQIVEEEEDDK
jgi:hypothetical protein